jgi:hypothetical protein
VTVEAGNTVGTDGAPPQGITFAFRETCYGNVQHLAKVCEEMGKFLFSLNFNIEANDRYRFLGIES